MNMKMLRRMQNKMVKIQEELAQETIEGTAGGGAVVVTDDRAAADPGGRD